MRNKQKNIVDYRLLIALLLISIIFFMVYLSFRTYKVEKFEENNKIKIVLVHASWCSHCTDYLKTGVFQQAGAAITSAPEFANTIQFEDVEFEAHKKRVEGLGVSGFPSIIATKTENGKERKILDFRANRESIQDITEFARSALATGK
jgi:glucan phosphoethanolaminetransferase (alkaline phosphatase superfamily)